MVFFLTIRQRWNGATASSLSSLQFMPTNKMHHGFLSVIILFWTKYSFKNGEQVKCFLAHIISYIPRTIECRRMHLDLQLSLMLVFLLIFSGMNFWFLLGRRDKYQNWKCLKICILPYRFIMIRPTRTTCVCPANRTRFLQDTALKWTDQLCISFVKFDWWKYIARWVLFYSSLNLLSY